jgi:dCTP diphosphatase
MGVRTKQRVVKFNADKIQIGLKHDGLMPEVIIHSTEDTSNLVVVDGKIVKTYCRREGSSNEPFCDGHALQERFHSPPRRPKILQGAYLPRETHRSSEAKCTHESNTYLMDGQTTIAELRKQISDFRDERSWPKDDTPKNLAISISVEAAELLEQFQWKTDEQIREVLKDTAKKNQVSDELADILILCLGFSDSMDIDISEAIHAKLRKAAEKYPVMKTLKGPKH